MRRSYLNVVMHRTCAFLRDTLLRVESQFYFLLRLDTGDDGRVVLRLLRPIAGFTRHERLTYVIVDAGLPWRPFLVSFNSPRPPSVAASKFSRMLRFLILGSRVKMECVSTKFRGMTRKEKGKVRAGYPPAFFCALF